MNDSPQVGIESKPARVSALGMLYFALVVLLCAAYSWRSIGSNADVWAHAAIGQWIVESGRAPYQTLFLWSAQSPWIAHSWLSEIVFYGLLKNGGEAIGPFLLLGLNVLLTALSFGLLWRLWSRRARVTTLMPFLFVLAIQASAQRFQVRPESFTAVFFALLLTILIRWNSQAPNSETTKPMWRRVLPLPLLFVVWTNFHGAVAFGLLILAVTIVCDLLQERASPTARALALAGVLCAAATLLNPYGLNYWTALGQVQSITFSTIDEWKPFWQAPVLGPEILVAQVVLITLAVAVWSWNPHRRWAHLAWLVAMTAAFVFARRNGWLLCLTSLSILAANAPLLETERLWREWQNQRNAAKTEPGEECPICPPSATAITLGQRRAAHLLAAAALIFTIVFAWPDQPLRPANVPSQLTNFVQAQKLPGKIFNNYDQSCYLHWRFQGQPPLFIDTLNAYPDSVMISYLQIFNATPTGRAQLDELGIGAIIMPRLQPGEQAPPLFRFLDGHPQWQLIYVEDDGIVWVRRPKVQNNKTR